MSVSPRRAQVGAAFSALALAALTAAAPAGARVVHRAPPARVAAQHAATQRAQLVAGPIECDYDASLVVRTNGEASGSTTCVADPLAQVDATVSQAPAHGDVDFDVFEDDVYYDYEPDPGYTGADAFKLTVSDGAGGSQVLSVGVTVSANADTAPVCEDSGSLANVRPGATVTFTPYCYDDQDDPFGLVIDSQPVNGGTASVKHVTASRDGEYYAYDVLQYTAPASHSGLNPFTVHAKQLTLGKGTSGTATTEVTDVAADFNTRPDCYERAANENREGDAADARREVEKGETALWWVDCYDREGDVVTVAVDPQPQSGPAIGSPASSTASGFFAYRPSADTAVGTEDDITVTASETHLPDGAQTFAPYTYDRYVTVAQPDANPVCGNQTVTTKQNTPVTLVLPCSDADAGDTVRTDPETFAQHGGLTRADDQAGLANAQVRFVYTPVPGFAGTDSFTYRARDGVIEDNDFITDDVSALGTTTIKVVAPTVPPKIVIPGLGTPTPQGPTADEIRAAIQRYLEQTVGPDVVKAIRKALKHRIKRSRFTVEVGPFDQAVTVDLSLVFGSSGSNRASAAKKTRFVAGHVRKAVAKDTTAKLKVKLSKKARKVLRRKGRLKVKATVKLTTASGATAKRTKTVTIKAKKARKRKQ